MTAELECDVLSAIINLSGSFAVGVSHLSDLFVREADSDQRSSLGSSLQQRLERFEISFSVLLLYRLSPEVLPVAAGVSRHAESDGSQKKSERARAHTDTHADTQPTLTFIESLRKRTADMTEPL